MCLHTHTVHKIRHTHTDVQRQLIHKRHISHLGHFLLPRSLWERSRSQILIPLVWSQRKHSFWETTKSVSKGQTLGMGSIGARGQNKYMLPQGCVFTICERSVCAFQQGWVSKLCYFPAVYSSFNRGKNVSSFSWFVSWFILLSFFACSSRCDTVEDEISQLACCDKWNGDRDDMETDHKSTQEIQPKSIFFLFPFFLLALEQHWGWFGLDLAWITTA